MEFLTDVVETTAPAVEDTLITVGEAQELFFEPSNFVDMLQYMGIGMLVIFVLIGVIILATMATNAIFSKKKDA